MYVLMYACVDGYTVLCVCGCRNASMNVDVKDTFLRSYIALIAASNSLYSYLFGLYPSVMGSLSKVSVSA